MVKVDWQANYGQCQSLLMHFRLNFNQFFTGP